MNKLPINRYILIALALLMLSACRKKEESLSFKSMPDVVIQEDMNKPLRMPPVYLNVINDSLAYFLYEFESVMVWNFKTGRLSGTIIPLMNIPRFLKEEVNRNDTLVMYDLNKEVNDFYRKFPRYMIHKAYIENGRCHMIVFITNPLLIREVLTILYVPLYMITNTKGELIEKAIIKMDSNIYISTNNGCIIYPEQKKFISSAFSPKMVQMLTATYEFNDSNYKLTNFRKFPVFYEGIKNNIIKSGQPFMLATTCDFRQVDSQLWVSNYRNIYNHNTGKMIISSQTSPQDDTLLRFIKSFVVFKNPSGKKLYTAYIEVVFPGDSISLDSEAEYNNLMIKDIKSGKVIKQIRLGKKVSGLAIQRNQLLWIEEIGENMVFKRLIIKFNTR